ncbi:AMIN-like domain-containing (lipo)protein [Blastococcus saxobsidens]|uniref:AMIN-like domain-containing protein n=1 Tax=Blastococcus saxobsidens TaxID=138336 RepID=A0A4Q7YBC0_9ACTN|nr:hypothetical protein [Blastococcus saxobsidens]RZU33425.1 hypothetical protein BKA19_3149 [Blastococcus saxobsidens]
MSSIRRLALPALLASLTLLTGCAGEGRSDTAASTGGAVSSSSSNSSAPTTEAESEAPVSSFRGDTEPGTAEPSEDARLTVGAVRLAAQPGFDRVVFELGGAGSPGWDVRYVEEATQDGSGAPVPVAGDVILQVRISGAGYPYDTGVEEYAAEAPLTAAGTGSVTEVVFAGTYEGVTSAFIGARAARPFRAYLLEGPTRLVVEVAHAG